MPDIVEMLEALPHAITPGPAGPDLAAADVARGHRALVRRRRRRLAGVTGTAAVGAVAAVLPITSVPRSAAPAKSASPAAPARSAHRASAATSQLMTLAARISASDSPAPGNASLEIVKNFIDGKYKSVYYGLYTDSGKLYSGDSKQTLMWAIAHNTNGAVTYDSQVKAAAREAAAGDLATARAQMIAATANVSPSQVSNVIWINATYALNWAGGDVKVRAGVLRLLSTIPAVRVVNSTTDGQPSLTITAGPGAFGGMGDEVLIISATTGLPLSSVSYPGPGVEDYQVSRVTLANVEAGKF
jgi:hypothetical protein